MTLSDEQAETIRSAVTALADTARIVADILPRSAALLRVQADAALAALQEAADAQH